MKICTFVLRVLNFFVLFFYRFAVLQSGSLRVLSFFCFFLFFYRFAVLQSGSLRVAHCVPTHAP